MNIEHWTHWIPFILRPHIAYDNCTIHNSQSQILSVPQRKWKQVQFSLSHFSHSWRVISRDRLLFVNGDFYYWFHLGWMNVALLTVFLLNIYCAMMLCDDKHSKVPIIAINIRWFIEFRNEWSLNWKPELNGLIKISEIIQNKLDSNWKEHIKSPMQFQSLLILSVVVFDFGYFSCFFWA